MMKISFVLHFLFVLGFTSIIEELIDGGKDLQCSACTEATKLLVAELKKRFRHVDNPESVLQSLEQVCENSFTDQWAKSGDEGNMKYAPFQSLMKSGRVTNLNMSPAIVDELRAVCLYVGKNYKDWMYATWLNGKKKLSYVKAKKYICVEEDACELKKKKTKKTEL